MINGFWTVAFQAPGDAGAGVVAINNNEIMGGDTSFSYVGPITKTDDGSIAGNLHIKRHSDLLPSLIPGKDDYFLHVSGKVVGDSFTLTGRFTDGPSPHPTIAIQGKRRLPVLGRD
uniref:hypothetical protein n=1 Tax=Castellaniella defragrans TaxID=75697 RepID=UPI00333FFDA6